MIRYGRENTWDEYDTLSKISVSIRVVDNLFSPLNALPQMVRTM